MAAFAVPRSADLSRLHAIVPVRGLSDGKGRLGEAIDAEEREALMLGLLDRTLAVLAQVDACRRVHVVSRDTLLLRLATRRGAGALSDGGQSHGGDGLNDALRLGRDAALREGATAVLCLPADLPVVSVEALERLLDAADAALAAGQGRPMAVIVPSDARDGTNALLLSPPTVIEPAFGGASLEAHLRAAAAAEASVQLVADPELGFDLDTPDDLERLDAERLLGLVELGARAADDLLTSPQDG
ncbi:MAG TPA: 2-phospho-L-lactate guanylyltransferase [Candidatus Limnocylindrales bacterium]|nr:2-phospho-L-lactate guanylyltransferase [Candidatus Limnocylindrales bacterium]